MRILHIGKYFPPIAGGIENFLCDLLPALSRKGIESALLVHEDWNSPYPPGTFDGIPAYRSVSFGTLLYAPISPGFPKAMHGAIHSFKPDLLHFHVPNTSAFWALVLPIAWRLPWIVHWHADVVASDLDRRMAFAYRGYRPVEQRLLARAHHIIATSQAYLKTSPSLRPWQEKCRVISLGLDPSRLPPPAEADRRWAQRQWGGGDGRGWRILAIGRLTYYKGHEFLIEAAADLPSSCRILIVGEGDRRAALHKASREKGLEGRVILMGGLPDAALHALLDTCDCLCLPSVERTEAFGLVLLEAMRYGKPVVASDVEGSGIGWVVENGVSGILVPPADAGALSAAIQRMMENDGLRCDMARAALERFEQHFRIDRVAGRIAALYNEILGCSVES